MRGHTQRHAEINLRHQSRTTARNQASVVFCSTISNLTKYSDIVRVWFTVILILLITVVPELQLELPSISESIVEIIELKLLKSNSCH